MNKLPDYVLKEFGANREYVEELYAQWRYSPVTVTEEWRRFFERLGDGNGHAPEPITVTVVPRPAPELPAPVVVAPELPDNLVTTAALVNPTLAAYEQAEPIRGVATLIVDNMEQSLGLPVATSQRSIPVKVLEENRRVINETLAEHGIKVSFTHLIAWAIVEALKKFPQMNAAYAVIEGKPHRLLRGDVNIGVAIDMEKKDGSRSLIVPNIKGANKMDFNQFITAYSDLIGRARSGKLTTDDYQGTTLTLTNPGTIGTVSSVPRLMEGQGVIIATGSIGFPAEYSATDPAVLSELGVSQVMGITSTYDHRIIQGAESGMFLAELHRLLVGEEAFYDRIFRSLTVPYPPVRWARDNKTSLVNANGSLSEKEAAVIHLIRAYRVRGHLLAHLNPLTREPKEYHPDLDLATYGLTLWDLDRTFLADGMGGGLRHTTLRHILEVLRRSYSTHLAIEYMDIQEPKERKWLQERIELGEAPKPYSNERRLGILESLSKAEAFEQFLHRRYVGSKRFSLEGAETVIPLLETVLDRGASQGVDEVIMGMAHRGRLNILKNILQKPARAIFSEFEGSIDPKQTQGTGDVKYHLGAHGIRKTAAGDELELTMSPNPSHLEAVNPVVEGMAHARQRLRVRGLDGLAIDEVMPVLIHGDAAFAGQGIVAETLNLSQLRGYRTGGTIHVIINNQIGFTTAPQDARSTPFATDIAKMTQAPVFHVNGDYPEDVVRAAEIALDYRQEFNKDVVIDLICYRRWGHQEVDDPSFTQPTMYKQIETRSSPREVYAQRLIREKVITQAEAQSFYDEAMAQLEADTEGLGELGEPTYPLAYDDNQDLALDEPPATGVTRDVLVHISRVLANPPAQFVVHPKLKKQLAQREIASDGTGKVDWATAEMLAFGSLLMEKFPVRLSGQDSGRGTFMQRHAVLHNYDDDEDFIPLNHLAEEQAPFRVWDSMLSEAAILAFEWGYALAAPTTLVLWEAQFGDFANGAQIAIDQFISSSAAKWRRFSDLVMLLPHGYEGQGPEHSSARLERYLQLCAEDNMRVAMPSTPANYFHLLRRQKHDDVQRPLIVMTPKSLLRLPAAASVPADFTAGRFQYVIDDPMTREADRVERVVFLSGKLYYDVAAQRGDNDRVAIVRVEQLYPYPRPAIREVLAKYRRARDIVWAQEEPRNQGTYSFIAPFLSADLSSGASLRYIGRPPAASPATGSTKVHQHEQSGLVQQILAK